MNSQPGTPRRATPHNRPQAIITQMAEQQARVDQMRTLATLKQKQLNDLKFGRELNGVLVDLPLQVGQHVTPGTMLGRWSQPNHLIAELKIAETQARDVQIGEPASVDDPQRRGRGHGLARRPGCPETERSPWT